MKTKSHYRWKKVATRRPYPWWSTKHFTCTGYHNALPPDVHDVQYVESACTQSERCHCELVLQHPNTRKIRVCRYLIIEKGRRRGGCVLYACFAFRIDFDSSKEIQTQLTWSAAAFRRRPNLFSFLKRCRKFLPFFQWSFSANHWILNYFFCSFKLTLTYSFHWRNALHIPQLHDLSCESLSRSYVVFTRSNSSSSKLYSVVPQHFFPAPSILMIDVNTVNATCWVWVIEVLSCVIFSPVLSCSVNPIKILLSSFHG